MEEKPNISIVIRSCNEEAELRKLISSLKSQNYSGQLEIIVVDNDSTDGTKEVAKNFGAKVVNIAKGEFTFPKSINLGMANASNELVILTIAHALPVNNNWLNSAVNYFINDSTVAGVFAHCLPNKKHTLAETIFYYPNYFFDKIRGPRIIKKREMGIMGATNCMLRRSLWEQNNFDESFELGGEDGVWAVWAINQGYKIIMDIAFTVYHSHHLGFKGLLEQFKYWSKLDKPQKFNYKHLKFRGRVFQNKF